VTTKRGALAAAVDWDDIPDGWEVAPLQQIADTVGGGTPSRDRPDYWVSGTIPWATPTDVTGCSGVFMSKTSEMITEAGLVGSSANLLPAGSVLLTSRATIGACCISTIPMATNQGFASLVPRDEADVLYLYYRASALKRVLQRLGAGTTFLEVSKKDIRRILIPLPTPGERQKIAAILRSVDEAIERTEAVIAALREVKRGMMQGLLTKGISGDGQIRDPQTNPEQFHDTRLGLLPKAWEIIRLGGLGKWHSGGTPSKSNPDYWEGDLPWVSPKDMKRLLLDDVEDHISIEGASSGSRTMPAETLLVVVRGLILAHSFPVAVITRPMAFNQDIKALACRNGVLPRFILYWLTSNTTAMLNLVTDSTHGTKRIDTGGLLRREMPLPPYDEQVAIHQRLAAADGD